ncbi:hypothetical protein ACFYYS_06985 [Streptomyces sp. NPDC002120]|uniref:hypothetical protein n=1 Tax=Streptomyces sp. NPDC002120 TaxID=3364631 RepID=UPI003682B8D1
MVLYARLDDTQQPEEVGRAAGETRFRIGSRPAGPHGRSICGANHHGSTTVDYAHELAQLEGRGHRPLSTVGVDDPG